MFHGLDGHYLPWGGGDPKPPPYPSRLRAVIYGFALLADEESAKRAGARIT